MLPRNTLRSLGSIERSEIFWTFLQHLHEVQENYGINLANKLTSNHVKYKSHKMMVDLAAQTLSSSVADATEFLNIIEKDAKFQISEGTIDFTRIIDQVFDIHNIRNPWES